MPELEIRLFNKIRQINWASLKYSNLLIASLKYLILLKFTWNKTDKNILVTSVNNSKLKSRNPSRVFKTRLHLEKTNCLIISIYTHGVDTSIDTEKTYLTSPKLPKAFLFLALAFHLRRTNCSNFPLQSKIFCDISLVNFATFSA